MTISSNPILTPEDKLALKELPWRIRKQKSEPPLLPWQQLFAYWVAFSPSPTLVQQSLHATELAGYMVNVSKVRRLHKRSDFAELVATFQEGGVKGALAKLKTDLPFYVDTHRKGLEMAVAESDYAAIPKYTLHALEIVAPRRNDLTQQNLQVNIVLSPKQQALEDGDSVTVTAEPIVADHL